MMIRRWSKHQKTTPLMSPSVLLRSRLLARRAGSGSRGAAGGGRRTRSCGLGCQAIVPLKRRPYQLCTPVSLVPLTAWRCRGTVFYRFHLFFLTIYV
ncbi:hypothetical protein U9M48_010316 [Paspalum notatum var. saurae]|uniref:Uncharacterized protein n=1 Tax=Paspalum notatum var. saurae TaxID=547442 RepID=A0AAQ3SSV6_PASNO